MLFKRYLIWISGYPPVQWSVTVNAILKEGIMGSIHVKSYEIRTSGSGGDVVPFFPYKTCKERLRCVANLIQIKQKLNKLFKTRRP